MIDLAKVPGLQRRIRLASMVWTGLITVLGCSLMIMVHTFGWILVIAPATLLIAVYGASLCFALPLRRPGEPWYKSIQAAPQRTKHILAKQKQGAYIIVLSSGHSVGGNVGPRPTLGNPAWCAHRLWGPATPVIVNAISVASNRHDIVLIAEVECPSF